MAEFSTPQTVPNPSIQDVAIMQFACGTPSTNALTKPIRTCPYRPSAATPLRGDSIFEQAWADQPAFLPNVLEAGQTREAGGSGAQGDFWKKLRSQSRNGALAGYFDYMRNWFPTDPVTKQPVQKGRIAAIGFSEGCNGIKELLSDPRDRDQIDFVYACDGMAGTIDPKTGSTETDPFFIDSISPWIEFAMKAASGERMMVVTHTHIIPGNYTKDRISTTKQAAYALLQEVKRRMAGQYSQVAPRTIPRGLIGEVDIPAPDVTYAGWSGQFWPGQHNTPQRPVRFFPPWKQHVAHWEVIGNLIVVDFNATSPDENQPESSRESAHNFQATWVMQQVIREVLACRWAAKCDTVNVTDGTSGLGATSIQPSYYIDPRFPTVVQKPNPAMLRQVRSATALGATIGGGCLVEGKFSNIPWGSSGLSAAILSQYSPAELAIGALGLTVGGIALYKYLTR